MAAGVYLHIPFCRSRCSYCDFATDVYRTAEGVERYVAALCNEIANTEPNGGTQIDTIYFGGGTPSLLTPEQVERILAQVHEVFEILPGAEVTMEMNPGTVTGPALEGYRSLGVNRASFGVQTFDDRALRLLARGHDANDARTTFRLLRSVGFENVSFDLIGGLPGQTLADWRRNVEEAVDLGPEHLSLYLLEVHQGTPLAEQIRSGRQPVPDEQVATEMYELMVDRLTAAGYRQYEISNFSRAAYESRHNTKYWLLDPVLGFGVSAHSFDGAESYANIRQTDAYVETIESGASPEVMRESIDAASESIFLGLRMESGIDLARHRSAYGIDLVDRFSRELNDLAEKGLIETEGGRLRLTGRGKLFSNEVFAVFV
jgi:oxygen-independent coproporphyrinogen-3 oxidase